MKLVAVFVFLILSLTGQSQTCTTAGQNPSTALPVCGTSFFEQKTVPLCGNRALPSKCKADGVTDTNPFWYKFTCFQPGTLGLLITPNNMGDDYDWEIYDITGHRPDDVYTDEKLSISCNWSGEKGLTGTISASNELFVCGGLGKPLFSKMPELLTGHDYLLLVSHFDPFTNSTDGYNLQFRGGTAVITDVKPPALANADANCGGDKIRVKLNKNMRCASIDADGSDFILSTPSVSVTGSQGIGCSSKFDTDSLELTLSQPLQPGNYSLKVKKGNDGNTLLDFCNNSIPEANEIPFTIVPRAPTPMDSLSPVSCAPQQLKLVFKKNILCNSIAADGTDFLITGSYPVTILGATSSCTDGLSKEIVINLSQPLQQQGNFFIQLKKGTDSNTILDECNEETPAGSTIAFSVKDTVDAGFTFNITYGCREDLVQYAHDGRNGVNSWLWNLDENLLSSQQDPLARYRIFRDKQVQLIVSNGFCTDTSGQTITIDNYLQAAFTVAEDNCPLEPVQFTSTATGRIISHDWNFGDGQIGSDTSPSHVYARNPATRDMRVRYTVTDDIGCTSTAEKTIKVYVSCIIDIPSAFSPNADAKNDQLYPLNAVKADHLQFNVYNRWGQLIYRTDNWKKGWDGRFNGLLQPAGLYLWTLRFTDRDSKKEIFRKGSTLLIR